MNSKFKKEIEELEKANVISPEVASKIYAYYSNKTQDNPNRLFTVFGVLGSVLVGLGIILILAHNWDDFSRSIKTILAFLPLLIGQAAVGVTLIKDKSNTWREASGAFLFFAVGACIALISQVYNIPGNLSEFLLTWLLLCLPLVYILKSKLLAVLHLVFSTYYACEYGYFFGTGKTPWLYLLLVVLFLPFYYQQLKYYLQANSTSIFNWLLPLSLLIALGAFSQLGGTITFLMYAVFLGVLYNIGQLSLFYNQKLRKNGYLIIGSLGTVVVLLIASFKWFWNDVGFFYLSRDTIITGILLVTAVLFLVYVHKKKGFKQTNLFQYAFLIITLVYFLGYFSTNSAIVLTNILVLALGVSVVKIGSDTMHFGILNYGMLIISALIACRFFDTNLSFVLRGLLFVVVGVGFFVVNYMMLKKQRAKELSKD